MGSKFDAFVDESTKKLMDIMASPDIDDTEKQLIAEALSKEMELHLNDDGNLKDIEYIIGSVSARYIDEQLGKLMTKTELTESDYKKAIIICSRQSIILKQFKDNSWDLDELHFRNIKECEEEFQSRMENYSITTRISNLDQKLDQFIKVAECELSLQACASCITLLEELSKAIDESKKRRLSLPVINNKDIKKTSKRVTTLMRNAEKKEELHEKISEIDAKIYGLDTLQNSTEQQWDDIIALCHQLNGLFAECKKNQWNIPDIRYTTTNHVVNKYKHYQVMKALDKEISINRENFMNSKQYKLLVDNCNKQQNNIKSCKQNNWDVPVLVNAHPGELLQIATIEKGKKDKAKKFKRKMILFAACAIALFILGLFGIHKYREGKIQIPFDAEYAIGQECDDVVAELEKAGFEKITTRFDTSGWLEPNTVMGVSIDNKQQYGKGSYCKPDVTVVVTYSSDDRVRVTDLLSGWDKKDYSELSQDLKDVGFTKITTKETETYDQNKDNLVAGLNLNYSYYETGECYLPKTAPIEICYYSLRINTGNSNAEFWGLDYKVVEENFINDGFTNVQTQKVETGWQKGNTVVEVTINNKTDYAGTDAFSPDAKVVIKYSSNNRVDITTVLSGWENKEYTSIQNSLKQKGFTEVTVKEKATTTKTQNKKIASISMNNEKFKNGDCYLQKTAPVVIEYYVLEITPGTPADEIEGMNYTDVVEKLKEKGFSNITLKRANDITLGWINKEGEIKKITIDGNKDFEESDKFRYDAEIVIVVHTYKNKGCEDITIIEK